MNACGGYFRSLVSGRLHGIWPGALRSGLWLASVPYGWAVRYRNRLFDRGSKASYKVPIPVVSVGNLTLGGTGKTPCVEYVARFYRRREVKVAILSRGYGSIRGRNDEAFVLEENLPDVPHLQGKDRVTLAQTAIEELESEILILDDGFQHRRLQRDLDLVLLQATNPWGYGYIFPRGYLREPLDGLGRAGVIILTHCDQVDLAARVQLRRQLTRMAREIPVIETIHRPLELINSEGRRESLDMLSQRPVAGFCGIGSPESFQHTLGTLGAEVRSFRIYPDHHAYSRRDVEELQAWAEEQGKDSVLVTTQKDLVKVRLAELGGRPLWALRIGLHIEAGQEELDHKLCSLVA